MLFPEHKVGVRSKRLFKSLSDLVLSEFCPKYTCITLQTGIRVHFYVLGVLRFFMWELLTYALLHDAV